MNAHVFPHKYRITFRDLYGVVQPQGRLRLNMRTNVQTKLECAKLYVKHIVVNGYIHLVFSRDFRTRPPKIVSHHREMIQYGDVFVAMRDTLCNYMYVCLSDGAGVFPGDQFLKIGVCDNMDDVVKNANMYAAYVSVLRHVATMYLPPKANVVNAHVTATYADDDGEADGADPEADGADPEADGDDADAEAGAEAGAEADAEADGQE